MEKDTEQRFNYLLKKCLNSENKMEEVEKFIERKITEQMVSSKGKGWKGATEEFIHGYDAGYHDGLKEIKKGIIEIIR